jgi:hypothetical protein
MYESVLDRRRRRGHRSVARERAGDYSGAAPEPEREPEFAHPAAPASPLAEALAGLDAAIDALAAVDLRRTNDRELLDATVTTQRLSNRLAAQQLRTLGEVSGQGAYVEDGAVTLDS